LAGPRGLPTGATLFTGTMATGHSPTCRPSGIAKVIQAVRDDRGSRPISTMTGGRTFSSPCDSTPSIGTRTRRRHVPRHCAGGRRRLQRRRAGRRRAWAWPSATPRARGRLDIFKTHFADDRRSSTAIKAAACSRTGPQVGAGSLRATSGGRRSLRFR